MKKIWIFSLFILVIMIIIWFFIIKYKDSDQLKYYEYYQNFFNRKEKNLDVNLSLNLEDSESKINVVWTGEWYMGSNFFTSFFDVKVNHVSSERTKNFSGSMNSDMLIFDNKSYRNIKNLSFFAGEGNIKNNFYHNLTSYLEGKKFMLPLPKEDNIHTFNIFSLFDKNGVYKEKLIPLLKYIDPQLSAENIMIEENNQRLNVNIESDYLKGTILFEIENTHLFIKWKLNKLNFSITLNDQGKKKILMLNASSSLDLDLKINWKIEMFLSDSEKKALQIDLDHYTPLETYLKKRDISF